MSEVDKEDATVPATTAAGTIPCSMRTRSIPACAAPRTDPPERTNTVLDGSVSVVTLGAPDRRQLFGKRNRTMYRR